MPYFQRNGLRLFYEEYGGANARPILLIPGLGEHQKSWLEVSQRLKEHYRVIAMDPRDAGLSQRASQPYSIADMALDSVALLTSRGIAQADVVGFSMGGAIAQELALSAPDRVRGLVLIATYDAGDPRGTAIFQEFSRRRRSLPREEYYRMLLPWIYTKREFGRLVATEDLASQLAADPLYQEPDAYERQVAAALAFRSRERLSNIACPAMLIFGDEDLITPVRFARSLEAGIKDSHLVLLSGAGHGLLRTRAHEVAGLIQAFLWSNPLGVIG